MENICLLQPSMAPFYKPLEVLTVSLDLVSKRNQLSGLLLFLPVKSELDNFGREADLFMDGRKRIFGFRLEHVGLLLDTEIHPRTRLGLTSSPLSHETST